MVARYSLTQISPKGLLHRGVMTCMLLTAGNRLPFKGVSAVWQPAQVQRAQL